MRLLPYTEADLTLTAALETDPLVMRELGGPVSMSAVHQAHQGRLRDPWWFKVVEESGLAVGTIGIWEKEHLGQQIHETGWMVLPAHQGKGVASAALAILIERVRDEPRFPSMHAFPPATNAPSNGLCRKFAFTLLDQIEFEYQARSLRCNHWMLETPTASRSAFETL